MKKLTWLLIVVFALAIFPYNNVYCLKDPLNYRDVNNSGDDHGWGGEQGAVPSDPVRDGISGYGIIGQFGLLDFLFWEIVFPVVDQSDTPDQGQGGDTNSNMEENDDNTPVVRNQSNR